MAIDFPKRIRKAWDALPKINRFAGDEQDVRVGTALRNSGPGDIWTGDPLAGLGPPQSWVPQVFDSCVAESGGKGVIMAPNVIRGADKTTGALITRTYRGMFMADTGKFTAPQQDRDEIYNLTASAFVSAGGAYAEGDVLIVHCGTVNGLGTWDIKNNGANSVDTGATTYITGDCLLFTSGAWVLQEHSAGIGKQPMLDVADDGWYISPNTAILQNFRNALQKTGHEFKGFHWHYTMYWHKDSNWVNDTLWSQRASAQVGLQITGSTLATNITAININGSTNLLATGGTVTYAVSKAATAADLAAKINLGTGTHGVTATVPAPTAAETVVLLTSATAFTFVPATAVSGTLTTLAFNREAQALRFLAELFHRRGRTIRKWANANRVNITSHDVLNEVFSANIVTSGTQAPGCRSHSPQFPRTGDTRLESALHWLATHIAAWGASPAAVPGYVTHTLNSIGPLLSPAGRGGLQRLLGDGGPQRRLSISDLHRPERRIGDRPDADVHERSGQARLREAYALPAPQGGAGAERDALHGLDRVG